MKPWSKHFTFALSHSTLVGGGVSTIDFQFCIMPHTYTFTLVRKVTLLSLFY